MQIDLLTGRDRDQMLALAGSLQKLAPFEEVFPVSAARGHGIAELSDYLVSRYGHHPSTRGVHLGD